MTRSFEVFSFGFVLWLVGGTMFRAFHLKRRGLLTFSAFFSKPLSKGDPLERTLLLILITFVLGCFVAASMIPN